MNIFIYKCIYLLTDIELYPLVIYYLHCSFENFTVCLYTIYFTLSRVLVFDFTYFIFIPTPPWNIRCGIGDGGGGNGVPHYEMDM